MQDDKCAVSQDREHIVFDSRTGCSKEFQSTIAPDWYWCCSEAEGGESFFTSSKLPKGSSQKYYPLCRAVSRPNFLLQMRVMAALHLAEALRMLHHDFCVYQLPPDAFFVNTESGDVQVFLEKRRNRETPQEGQEEALKESQFVRFGAYATFRLLCVENPFDGQETLVEYPLLTPNALRKIHSGEYGFIFSECGNRFSEYSGKETLMRWRTIPSGLRESMKEALSAKESLDTEDWLNQMRMLRDSLVYVNGRFRLCDPALSNNVLFVEAGDFKIPIYPRKAVYWYHVGLRGEQTDQGIAVGITGDRLLKNLTTEKWRVVYEKMTFFTEPGDCLEPKDGMQIQIEDTCLRIINGKVPNAPCTIPQSGSWAANGQEHRS